MKKSVTSFDVFDTLVARRCIEPIEIFREVERHMDLSGFTILRSKAESEVDPTTRTLESIYKKLLQSFQPQHGFDLRKVMELEIKAEIDNAIPIQENLERVRDGDLLVSDMYLPRYVIETILSKCGLRKLHTLVLTPMGKYYGTVWPALLQHVNVKLHIGDSVRSDYQSPRAYLIPSILYSGSSPTRYEQFLLNNGLINLARLVREVRLMQPSLQSNRALDKYRSLQIEFNFPLLVIYASYLLFYCANNNIKRVLFCSRDCWWLKQIFDIIKSSISCIIETKYFFSSRFARVKCSDAYLRYCRSLLCDDTLVVDLTGTGWSLATLWTNLGISPKTSIFVLDATDTPPTYFRENTISQGPASKPTQFNFLVKSDTSKFINFELLNWVSHGSSLDVIEDNEIPLTFPLLSDLEYPDKIKDILDGVDQARRCAESSLSRSKIADILNEIGTRGGTISLICKILLDELSNQGESLRELLEFHSFEHSVDPFNSGSGFNI